MAQRKLHDRYFKQAKAEGYLARSAYKLIEIDERFKLLRSGMRVLDVELPVAKADRRLADADPELRAELAGVLEALVGAVDAEEASRSASAAAVMAA